VVKTKLCTVSTTLILKLSITPQGLYNENA
jgi:hypothetical protein